MSASLTSVVIPSYNHGRFIREAVESVLDQGGADLEVLLVDDGSTDDTLERLAPLRDDPRLRVLHQENQGAHAALNRGISLSRGEIIFILNSDDAYEAERVSRFLQRFEDDSELTLLSSWIRVVDEAGQELGVKQAYRNMPPGPRPRSGPGLADTGKPELALLESNYVASTSNIAFRRELFFDRGLRFLPLRYTHDWDFLLTASRSGRLGLVEEPLLRYRVHGGSTIGEGGRSGADWGAMRFEILWVVARHAETVCRLFESPECSREDLRRRLWNSVPRFGCETQLAQLLLLRGESAVPQPSYDALLKRDHPFRRMAEQQLASSDTTW